MIHLLLLHLMLFLEHGELRSYLDFFLLVIQCLVENDADEDQKNSQDKKFQAGFLGVKCGQEINKLKQKSADEKQRD